MDQPPPHSPSPSPSPPQPMPAAPRRGRPKKPGPVAGQLLGLEQIGWIEGHLQVLHDKYDHPNRKLHYDQWLVAMLLAFFNAAVRSLRVVEDVSQAPKIQKELDLQRVGRKAFSEGTHLFDPRLLLPIIRDLRNQLPGLRHADPKLAQILKQVMAVDGSYFTIPAHVLWALHHTKINGKTQAQIRLNLQIRVQDQMPGPASVSGQAQGLEANAMAELLEKDAIYVGDRHYVNFAYLRRVAAVGSDFLIRARSNAPTFTAERTLPLSDADIEHGVVLDQIGLLPGSAIDGQPPLKVRQVVIQNRQSGETVRLLTTLLEAPAEVIGLLYRARWQIELFFRWLKVWANFEHLMAHSQNGITLQFYVAVIATLLMYVRSGRRLSKYAYAMLGLVAAGQATMEEIIPILERRERESDLARARLARKKAAQKQS